ncbi:MAG TPA: hypothetical protein PK095_17220, partial [Myxococcota bacterium]|nr:hypothetical protein [Myxococcota bacterium]
AAGSCEGRLVCGDVGGESAPVCDGPAPLVESCNGEDDDCDGSTDEATCDDGLLCTTDSCAAPVCSNTLQAGSCLIGGACFANGQFNPLNPCERCDTDISTATWTRAPNTCQIDGACYPANAVNPQNACQVCQPNVSPTQWTTATNTCQIGGQCWAANQANPNSPCQICNPLVSTSSWSQANNTCQIQGQCYAAGVTRPGVQCQLCDPQRSATGWSLAGANVSCDDNNACSAQSFCNGAGLCVGDTSCNDGVACTEDICYPQVGCDNSGLAPGFCRIGGQCVPQNTSNPTNPCERCNPAISTTQWAPQPNNVGCSDNLYCTVNDRCDGAGRCVGEARSCGDGLVCTTDSCLEGSDRCDNALAPGQCVIGGVCYPQGATQANNVCYACNPASSTSGWSLNNNAPCNDGDSCTVNDRCSGGVCVGGILRDPWENNDTISAAFNLGNFTDAQSFPQRTVSTATIAGASDVDWYVYFMDDVWNGLSEPRVRVGSIAPTFAMEACVFIRCTEADALPQKLDCARVGATSGGLVTYGGKEHRGCCRTGSNTINLELSANEFDCPGDAEDYRALVRVRNTNDAWTCNAPYSLEVGNDGTQQR